MQKYRDGIKRTWAFLSAFRWWQCSDRYIISLSPTTFIPPPHPHPASFSLSLISLMVSVDVKHHVYLLICGCMRFHTLVFAVLSCFPAVCCHNLLHTRYVPRLAVNYLELIIRPHAPHYFLWVSFPPPPPPRPPKLCYCVMMMMMNWCLMSSDVIWHIRDKL